MTAAIGWLGYWTRRGPEELAPLVGERLRLLQRGEMAAARHYGPAPDIGVGPLSQRAGWTQDLGRELSIPGRNVDGLSIGNGPRPVPNGVIGPKRRADRAGEPIKTDIREQSVASECGFDIAAAIRPGAELLDDPRGQARGRVAERKGERLRLGALNPLVAGFVSEPYRAVVDIGLLVGSGVGQILLIAPDRQQVEVDADQLLGMGIAEARGGDGAPGAPLDGKAGITQRAPHQLGDAIGDLLDAKARLPRFERQAVTG